MAKLNLKKPLVIFDLETTGINVALDRIVEIALIKVNIDGSEEEKLFRVNPGVSIPKEASEIHGIYDEDVKDEPKFFQIAKQIASFIEGCDLGGFNSNRFDIPLLSEEFLRADLNIDLKRAKFVDAQTIFHKMEKRTLEAAYKFYCGESLENAHSALADTRATLEVFKSQIDRYEGVEYVEKGVVSTPIVNDIAKLSEFSAHSKFADYAGRIGYNEKGEEIFTFGKYKDKVVADILAKDSGYFGWMLNSDFPLYTKKVLTEIKLRALQNR